MRYVIVLLSSALFLTWMSGSASAGGRVICTLETQYLSRTVSVEASSGTASAALSEAMHLGCQKVCHAGSANADKVACEIQCLRRARFPLARCLDSQKRPVPFDLEAVRFSTEPPLLEIQASRPPLLPPDRRVKPLYLVRWKESTPMREESSVPAVAAQKSSGKKDTKPLLEYNRRDKPLILYRPKAAPLLK